LLIEDLVILGRAVPVLLPDQRKTICTAGYSHELGFVRIYPTFYYDDIHLWDIVSINVKKESRDSRSESWKKLTGSEFKKIGSLKDDKKGKETLLESICQNMCTHDLNEEKRSLAVIKPEIVECHFKEISDTEDGELVTMSLVEFFSPPVKKKRKPLQVKSNFNVIPYVRYNCSENCRTQKPHNQQILEWGAYKWIQKNPDNIDQVWRNFHLSDDEWYKYFFIGNLRDQRTSWLIISILRGKKNDGIEKENGKILYQSNEENKKKQKTLF
jgi:hypothetical protein